MRLDVSVSELSKTFAIVFYLGITPFQCTASEQSRNIHPLDLIALALQAAFVLRLAMGYVNA